MRNKAAVVGHITELEYRWISGSSNRVGHMNREIDLKGIWNWVQGNFENQAWRQGNKELRIQGNVGWSVQGNVRTKGIGDKGIRN